MVPFAEIYNKPAISVPATSDIRFFMDKGFICLRPILCPSCDISMLDEHIDNLFTEPEQEQRNNAIYDSADQVLEVIDAK